jgi:hypothetical protein
VIRGFSNDDPVTAEHAPAPWRRGARTEGGSA